MGIRESSFNYGFNSIIICIPINWSDTKLHLLGSLSIVQNNVPPKLMYITNAFSSANFLQILETEFPWINVGLSPLNSCILHLRKYKLFCLVPCIKHVHCEKFLEPLFNNNFQTGWHNNTQRNEICFTVLNVLDTNKFHDNSITYLQLDYSLYMYLSRTSIAQTLPPYNFLKSSKQILNLTNLIGIMYGPLISSQNHVLYDDYISYMWE